MAGIAGVQVAGPELIIIAGAGFRKMPEPANRCSTRGQLLLSAKT